MKKIIAAALAMAPVILVGAAAHAAANTSSATANVSTTILSPISVSKTTDLAFGTVVKPTLSGGSTTFTVTNAGALTASGGDGAAVASNSHSAAAFTVSGEGGQAFTLSIPSSVTLAGPSSSSIVVSTSNDVSGTACLTFATCTLSGTLGGAGSLSFHVGGSFAVTNAQMTGLYQNTTDLTVTATYN
jgi:hypothetical protein